MLSLRDLKPGEFYSFGVAIEPHFIHKIKITLPQTTHPKVGVTKQSKPMHATEKIKSIMAKISDLPKDAEKEAKNLVDMQKKINELQMQLKITQKNNSVKKSQSTDPRIIEKYNNQIRELNNSIRQITISNRELQNRMDNIARISGAKHTIIEIKRETTATIIPKSMPQKMDISENRESTYGEITGGALKMLKSAAMFYPKTITRAKMATISGLSYKSGTFGTYLAILTRNGLLVRQGDEFEATEEGLEKAGDISSLPTDPKSLLNMWLGIIKGGASRMLQALFDTYPNTMSKEELGESAGISSSSGTFGTYLAILKRNGLIKVDRNGVKLSDDFYDEK
jgi:hypothetical protein